MSDSKTSLLKSLIEEHALSDQHALVVSEYCYKILATADFPGKNNTSPGLQVFKVYAMTFRLDLDTSYEPECQELRTMAYRLYDYAMQNSDNAEH